MQIKDNLVRISGQGKCGSILRLLILGSLVDESGVSRRQCSVGRDEEWRCESCYGFLCVFMSHTLLGELD